MSSFFKQSYFLFGLFLAIVFTFNVSNAYSQLPEAADDFFAFHGSSVVIDVTANDTCQCNLIAQTLSQTTNGTIARANFGRYIYQPNAGFSGTDSFTYKACHESNTSICSQSATVTIDAQNQAPVVIDDFMIVRSTNPAFLPRGFVRYIENDFDPDNDPLTAGGAVPQPSPTKGYFDNTGFFGNVGFVSNGTASGYEEFFYKLSDNLGMFSGIATVSAYILPIDGAEDAGGTCPLQRVGEPVNVTNGNMWIEHNDYNLPGIGENISVNRFYNSIIKTGGLFRFWLVK